MELSFPVTHAWFVAERQRVGQANKTFEVVNIVQHSVQSDSATMDQEPNCSSTEIPTDDENVYVLVPFIRSS
jgi:hypothetical protein